MSSKKPEANAPQSDVSAPIPAPARKPRKSRVTQPAWYKATFKNGTYRIIEADDELSVYAQIAVVTAATPQDFAQAGADDIKLESKVLQSAIQADEAES